MAFTPEQAEEQRQAELAGARASAARRSSSARAAAARGRRSCSRASETTIGRSPDCDIFLDDVTVSRQHAVVRRGGGALEIEDLGSLNGTFLNRKRIESPAELSRRRRAADRQVPADLPPMTTAPASERDAAADDRRRLRAAEGASSRTSRSRRSATSRARASSRRADARRLPALRRGGARAARDDPAPPARRVPAAEGDPRGAREADVAGAAAPPRARASRRRGRARPARRSASAPASTAGSRASSRSTGCSRRASTAASGFYSETDAEIAAICGRLAGFGIAPRHLRTFRTSDRPRDRPARGGDRARAPLAEPRAAAAGDARPPDARRARAGARRSACSGAASAAGLVS